MTNQSAVDAAATLRSLANGLRVSQALLVAAELRLADYLAKRPHDRFELATATGVEAGALGRVMRALCALGVFLELPSGHFSLESVGQFLRSEVPGSYRAGVLFHTGAVRWRCWSELLRTVRTGACATKRLLGKELFDFYAGDAAESKIHDEAMRAFSASSCQTSTRRHRLPSHRRGCRCRRRNRGIAGSNSFGESQPSWGPVRPS